MGYFKVDDDFVRLKARNLSLKAIAVYIALCCHANKNGNTFVGHRTLAKELGINKDSVTRAMAELEASEMVRRSKGKNGQASEITIITVRNDTPRPSETVRPKEDVFKEDIKERDSFKTEEARDEIRKRFGWH